LPSGRPSKSTVMVRLSSGEFPRDRVYIRTSAPA
jgi:hypothetical protein